MRLKHINLHIKKNGQIIIVNDLLVLSLKELFILYHIIYMLPQSFQISSDCIYLSDMTAPDATGLPTHRFFPAYRQLPPVRLRILPSQSAMAQEFLLPDDDNCSHQVLLPATTDEAVFHLI